MPLPVLPVEEVLTILADTPRQLDSMTAALTETQLRTPPAPGEWSVNEILAHLRACADVRGAAALRTIAEERPRIPVVNPREYLKTTDYLKLDFATSLRAFADDRAKLLDVLRPLPSDGWSRPAEIVRAASSLEGSVLYYAVWIATHEVPHLDQIRAAIDSVAE
jgi:DinB family protein